LVDGNPALVLVNGTDPINTAVLSEIVGGTDEIPRIKEAQALAKRPIGFVSGFGVEWQDRIFVSESVLTEEFVYTAAGFKHVLMKVKPVDLLQLLPKARVVRNFTAPPPPVVLFTAGPQEQEQELQRPTILQPAHEGGGELTALTRSVSELVVTN